VPGRLDPSALIDVPRGVLSSRFQVIADSFEGARTTAVQGFGTALLAARLPGDRAIVELVAEDSGADKTPRRGGRDKCMYPREA
jgi:hypothetical protein